jgi:hypothetical protein
MNQRYLAYITIAMNFLAIHATASEVLTVDVKIDGDVYRMHGESIIQAPTDFVFNILADYDNFHRITNGIAESRYLEPDDDGVLLGYTRIDSCVWFYCRRFEKVERIWTTAPTEIITEAIPEKSDFKIGNARWTLKSVENGTLVIYDADVDPDFWVPPVIGPWAFKKKLRDSAEVIGWRIEYLFKSGKSLSEFGSESGAEDSTGAMTVSEPK